MSKQPEVFRTSVSGVGPWCVEFPDGEIVGFRDEGRAHLIAAASDLLEALHEGRRAIGEHSVPGDCYATGPATGDPIRDLVSCPACSFVAAYDAAIAKAVTP